MRDLIAQRRTISTAIVLTHIVVRSHNSNAKLPLGTAIKRLNSKSG